MSGLEMLGAEEKKKLAISATVGGVVGATALAMLWRSHRILGGLLGFFVIGPVAGAGVGYAIVKTKALKAGEKPAGELSAHGKKK